MKYINIYNYAIRKLEKIKKQEDRVSNLFMLITCLIWRFSLGGKYLDQTLKMINEFDYKRNFGEKEENDSEISKA